MLRRRPRTAAAEATNITVMYTLGSMAPRTGAPTTPARLASTMPMIQAQREVKASSTPRVLARSARSTTARI